MGLELGLVAVPSENLVGHLIAVPAWSRSDKELTDAHGHGSIATVI
jgi:hypothetical protein